MKLFGSKAKGDFDEESDRDVVIALDEVNWAIEKDIYEICFHGTRRNQTVCQESFWMFQD